MVGMTQSDTALKADLWHKFQKGHLKLIESVRYALGELVQILIIVLLTTRNIKSNSVLIKKGLEIFQPFFNRYDYAI